MRTFLIFLILATFRLQAFAEAPHWSQGGEQCADREVSTPLFELHFELERSGKCLYMKTKRHHPYILHDVPPEEIQQFQSQHSTFSFESFRICRDSQRPKMTQEILNDLHQTGVIKYRSGIFTNLAYTISRGLRAQGIHQNGIYFYSLPERRRCVRMDYSETGHLEVLSDRSFYPEIEKQEHWRHMELYWSLIEIFKKHGEELDEYSFVPEEIKESAPTQEAAPSLGNVP